MPSRIASRATKDALQALREKVIELSDLLGQPEEPDAPEAIATAPREPQPSLLLFCPEQGGWHVGEWWAVEEPGKWIAAISTDIELEPTHWAYVLPDPE